MSAINTNVLDVRTILVGIHTSGKRVLLLRRSATKKLFPGLMTGVGGKVELHLGEGQDLLAAALREGHEETPQIDWAGAQDLRLRLVTHDTRDLGITVLLWYTCRIPEVVDMSCSEGELLWADVDALPKADMVPTSRLCIPFVLGLPADDMRVYDAVVFTDAEGQRVLRVGR